MKLRFLRLGLYVFQKELLRQARQVLNDESVGLNETAWARLSFLKSCGDYDHDRLDTIEEAETTGKYSVIVTAIPRIQKFLQLKNVLHYHVQLY